MSTISDSWRKNENLYSYLQRQTLEEVHRLSGKVWTDFNAHDPGVTLADIANYALTEMDYKLGFGTMDYLTGEDGIFEPERFGLFPPEKVYTTAPVTLEDYRRLFFARIPELENVWVECNAATGGYTVKIALPPFEEEDNGKTVVKQVAKIYNSHRNLCEYLDKVIIVRSAELEFHAEFEIEPGKKMRLLCWLGSTEPSCIIFPAECISVRRKSWKPPACHPKSGWRGGRKALCVW